MAWEQCIQAQEIGGWQQKASRTPTAHPFVGTVTGKLEGFEEQVSPERHQLSPIYKICLFCKLSRGKMKQQRVAVIAEKLCLHCEMILLKNSNNCLKTCPFWSTLVPPTASWHWHPWVQLLQKMSGLTSNWQTRENASTSPSNRHYKWCYILVILGL